jgi:hypothetical protein
MTKTEDIMAKKIYRIVACKPGEAPKTLEEAQNLTAARGDGTLLVPPTALTLSMLSIGGVELAPEGGVK